MAVPRSLDLIGRAFLPRALGERLAHTTLRDAGHGYDAFGMNPDWVRAAAGLFQPLYGSYFRVTSHGAENVPANGGAVLAANHSGTIPIDAMMIWNDVLRQTDPPRVARAVLDHFVNLMPMVSIFFARCGAIGGSRGNFHELLRRGELVLVFPEGLPAIGKPWSERYKLCAWREGHAEMAIRHGVPIVPIAVIGAEEQLPTLGRLDSLRPFGLPYTPIPATPLPLPVHYHLWYGEPIPTDRDYSPDQADDSAVVKEASERVREAVEGLIAQGLAKRKGVFR